MHALIRDGQIVETRNLRETWFDGNTWSPTEYPAGWTSIP